MNIDTQQPHKIFDKTELVPPEWLGRHKAQEFHTYNPAIFCHAGSLIMAVRICGPDMLRKIALLRLTDRYDVAPGSLVALSDHFKFRDHDILDDQSLTWFAEPRMFSVGPRLFMHFNNGGLSNNRIFLLELDPNSLLPLGQVREVVTAGPRRDVEKNWIFFEHDEVVYTIYSHNPFQVMRVELHDQERVLCQTAFTHEWDAAVYTARFGEIRGGTTPVHFGADFITMCHSVYEEQNDDGVSNSRSRYYVGGFLTFERHPPFRPLQFTGENVLRLLSAERRLPLLPKLSRAKESFYPCGLIDETEGIAFSYGINNDYAGLRKMSRSAIQSALKPIAAPALRAD